MKIKIWLKGSNINEVAAEMKDAIAQLTPMVEGWADSSNESIHATTSGNYIYLIGEIHPPFIEQAFKNAGYEEETGTIVGVNQQSGKCLFKDNINNQYLVAPVILEFKDGKLEAEYGCGLPDDCYDMGI